MSAAFALALLSVDGLGQTTAHRLLDRFPAWEALRETPREQVRLRLKGTPRVDHLLDVILSNGFNDDHLTPARATVATLRQRGIHTIARGNTTWPEGLNDLDRSDRPVVLYGYGQLDALARPSPRVPGQASAQSSRV